MNKTIKTTLYAAVVAISATVMSASPSSAGATRVYIQAQDDYYLQLALNRLTHKFIDQRNKFSVGGGTCRRTGRIKRARYYSKQYGRFTGHKVSQWITCTIIR